MDGRGTSWSPWSEAMIGRHCRAAATSRRSRRRPWGGATWRCVRGRSRDGRIARRRRHPRQLTERHRHRRIVSPHPLPVALLGNDEVDLPWRQRVTSHPDLPRVRRQVDAPVDHRRQRSRGVRPRVVLGRQQVQQSSGVRAEYCDVDVDVVPPDAGEPFDRVAPHDPPRRIEAGQEPDDVIDVQRRPWPVPPHELGVVHGTSITQQVLSSEKPILVAGERFRAS
jgi:hypothetical protein